MSASRGCDTEPRTQGLKRQHVCPHRPAARSPPSGCGQEHAPSRAPGDSPCCLSQLLAASGASVRDGIAAFSASSFPLCLSAGGHLFSACLCPGFPSSLGHQSLGPTPVPPHPNQPHPHRLHSQGQDTIRHTPNSQHRCGIRGTVPVLSQSGSPPIAGHMTSNLPEALFPEPRFPTC